MIDMDLESIKKQALKELEYETFREEVEKMRIKLRSQMKRKSYFPWRIKLININKEY